MPVFVLDDNRKPLDPCTPARARILLAKGRAAVFRRFPFTIILNDRLAEATPVHQHRIKIDPGSKTTGVAIVQEATGLVVAAVEIEHRGGAIKASLEYQQGALAGYELREYLLEKHERTCAYCDQTDVPLQVEHIVPRSKGGTDRVSNLTLACAPCNRRKGNTPIEVFLKKDPDRLTKVLRDAKRPLKDATAVNATRWELYRRLQATGLPVETGSGGRTKFNRTTRGLPKTHWLDAACVGASTPETLLVEGVRPLLVKACGQGARQRQNLNKYGSPRGNPARRPKTSFGFQTGDIVRADIPTGKNQGRHTGRIALGHTPSFRMGPIEVHSKYLTAVHRADGYNYNLGETIEQ